MRNTRATSVATAKAPTQTLAMVSAKKFKREAHFALYNSVIFMPL